MHAPHDLDLLATSLLQLVGMLNSPRQDDVLLREAGVTLDRALFPLLARIGMAGSIGVVDLAEQVGRDHSTISRQVAKLEALGLVTRQDAAHDRRIVEARTTRAGKRLVGAITRARRRLLQQLLAGWTPAECRDFARLSLRLAEAMQAGQRQAARRPLR